MVVSWWFGVAGGLEEEAEAIGRQFVGQFRAICPEANSIVR